VVFVFMRCDRTNTIDDAYILRNNILLFVKQTKFCNTGNFGILIKILELPVLHGGYE
jgi:hypothetical protein